MCPSSTEKMTNKILLVNLIRKFWRYVGYSLTYTSNWMQLAPFLSLFILLTVPTLGLLLLFLEEASIPNIANAFESIGPYSQLFVKCCLTRASVKLIRELLNEIESKFWPIDFFGEQMKQKQLKIVKIIEFCLKGYITCICPTIIFMIVKPLFYSERMYPLQVRRKVEGEAAPDQWDHSSAASCPMHITRILLDLNVFLQVYNIIDINNTYYFLSYYSIQAFAFYYASGCFIAIDGLFALYVVNVFCQLIMLQYAFTNLDIGNTPNLEIFKEKYEKLKKYIDHHNLILRFILKMQKIYSMQLFFQFVGNTASICMGVYIVSSAGMSDLATSARAAFIVSVWFCQLSIYCVGGNLLTEACAKVAISMYDSHWEGKYNAKFRYATQMVIMQSQKPNIMRAGKFFGINLSSFSGIVRLAVSLYTLMNKVQDNKIK